MKIKGIAHALPSTVYSSEQIAHWTGAEAEFISEKVGAEQRFYLQRHENGVDLAAEAVSKLLSEHNLEIGEIDLIVYVTQTPDHSIPHNSALLHGALAGRDSTACFDVGLGCSGYPYAISIARGFMQLEAMEKAIIVTCDPYSKIMDRNNKSTVTVFGDAATATLIASDGHISIGKGDFGTRGRSGKSTLWLKQGNAAFPIKSIHDDTPQLNESDEDGYQLFMNGRNVFNFVMTEIPKSLDRVLGQNNVKKEDVDLFALHQGSRYMLENLVKRYGIENEKVIFNIQKFGNTVSSSVPLVVEEIMRTKPNFSGTVMMSGFGVGVSWASNLLFFE